MYTLKGKIKNTTVNKFKLIYTELFIGVMAIFIISLITYLTSKNLLLEQMKENGLNLAKQTVLQVKGNTTSLEMVNGMIEDKIRAAEKIVSMNGKNINDDLLKKICGDLKVDEICWYSPEGEIIYSNLEQDLGWKSSNGHPVENFRISDKRELMEEIRQDTVSGDYKKYGYLRNDDGTFIQVGIKANEVESLTEKFTYQTLVEKLSVDENVARVILVDKNLKTIADSNKKNIGNIYSKNQEQEIQEALDNKISTKESYYEETGKKVMTIYIPVNNNGNITNVLILSYSTEKVYYYIYMFAIKSSIIAIIVILGLLWIKNKNIIKPVNRLDQCINEIDIENNIKYRIPLEEGDTFFGIVSSINNILDKTASYFYELKEYKEELQASNEEISATYQQLSASEDELRTQYEEIQDYTQKLESLQEELKHIAYYDFLTDLPNRRMFIKKLEEEINENKFGAVMLMDIDNFKGINDTLGHSYGDKVLIKVAEELKNYKDEKIFVSRFGGDEFFILFEAEEDGVKIENYAKHITDVFRNKLLVENEEIYMRL